MPLYVQVGDAEASAELGSGVLAVADTRFSCGQLEQYVKLRRAAQQQRKGIWSMIPKGGKPDAAMQQKAGSQGLELWASTTSDKYHLPSCGWAKRIKPENLVRFGSVR